jgi:3-hydroxybutyryl-CoA dehydrogenase
MGAQIGCEYALGGHDVALAARDLDAVTGRVDAAFATLTELDLVSAAAAHEAAGRVRYTSDVADAADGCEVIVESLPEDLELKADVLRKAAGAAPDALIASNTSSLRVTDIGRELGAGDRTVGTHYWNPPLLMPLVEIVAGDETDPSRVEFAADLVAGLGKTPVTVADIPGFVWNRLQFAIVREAAELVASGAVSPETLDRIVQDGLARRWRQIGPLHAIALGGVDTWNAAASQIVPDLSTAEGLPDLAQVAVRSASPEALIRQRDRGLASDLARSFGPEN